MLPQSDFDDSTSNPVQCELGNGRVVKWAAMAPAAVRAELGVPANWRDLDARQKSAVIVAASKKAEVWPNNSHPRELLVQLAAEVAREMVAAGGQHGEPGVCAGSSASSLAASSSGAAASSGAGAGSAAAAAPLAVRTL